MSEPLERYIEANEAAIAKRYENGEMTEDAYKVTVSGLELVKNALPGIFIFGEH